MNWKNVRVLNNENNSEDNFENLRSDALKYREQLKQKDAFDKKVQSIKAQWQKDCEALKSVVPEFDFEQAMQNREFYERIMRGESIPIAYLAINNSQMTSQPKRRAITQNGQSTSNANGSPEQNVAGMSDEDFQKYLRNLKNR